MNDTMVVQTDVMDSNAAGEEMGKRIAAHFGSETPDALILFASSRHHYSDLLQALDRACHPKVLVGCSSAGEFTGGTGRVGTACAFAIRSPEMKFFGGVGRGLRLDRGEAARQIVSSFEGWENRQYPYRSVLLLTDALAGYTDDLIERITWETRGDYQLFGGGAGDDANFKKTVVFCGTEAIPDAAVSLEILSHKPLGIGVHHGWSPASARMRVTESAGMCLISLNSVPALEVFEEHARATGQSLDRQDPIPFFLHNILGVDTGEGYKLRVPLSVNSDGSIGCASDIGEGSTVCFMKPESGSAAEATAGALRQLGGNKPKAALFFDCVATRLRMGRKFDFELGDVQAALGGECEFAGCNTYGQIARADGQFSGFHNCTAVVCIFPE